MAVKKGRKATGGRYKKPKQASKSERTRQPRVVKLGNKKVKEIRGRGGKNKLVLLTNNSVNVLDSKGKSKKAVIKTVLETPSNRFLARQNILVKGAVIETELGKARITNRPSQEGTINAVILED